MTNLIGAMAGITLLAIVGETLVEKVKEFLQPKQLPSWLWFAIASGYGILVCISFGVEFFSLMGFSGGPAATVIAQVITGIAVGAGSGVVHKIQDKMNSSKQLNKLLAEERRIILDEDDDKG